MKKVISLITAVALVSLATAANLNISGQSNRTYDGGTYDLLIISSNCSNITVKNCNFKTPSGTDAPGEVSGNTVTIENCNFDGNKDACAVVNLSGSNITFRNCWFHNAADDGIQCHSGTNIKFLSCIVSDLYGCGTDNGCGPCYNGHSDGWEMSGVTGAEFIGNLAYNIPSTSGLFMGNWGPTNANFLLANNLFYTPDCGFNIYVHYIDGIKIYNNTFWKGSVGGLALGPGVTNLVARNNIFSAINLNHAGITLNPAEHDFDYNVVGLASQGMPLQAHDVMAPNVLFQRIPAVIGGTIIRDVKPEDFALKTGSPAIGKGTSGGDIPTTDFFGNTRTVPYDCGGIETQGTAVTDQVPELSELVHAIKVTPNPFTTVARITFGPAGLQPVTFAIHDMQGRTIRSFTGESVSQSLAWDGCDQFGRACGEGCYQLKVVYPDRVEYRPLVLVK